MKKIFIIITLGLLLGGCGNMQMIDTTWSFQTAIVKIPDGECIKGPVTSWTDYEDSDMVQVVINGTTYYTHGSNIVLISE